MEKPKLKISNYGKSEIEEEEFKAISKLVSATKENKGECELLRACWDRFESS